MINQTNAMSSGNLFLDKIIGQFNLGSIVLLIEDNPTEIYKSMVKYFIAEGVVREEKVFFYYSDARLNEMNKTLPYKSTQVEAILNAKKVSEKAEAEIKIAWRYENIQYSNILSDLAKSSKYIFDLSRNLQDSYFQGINKNIIQEKQIEKENPVELLDEFIQCLIRDYQSYAEGEDPKYARIVFPNLFANLDSRCDLKSLKLRLVALRNVVRSLNGVVYLTLNMEFMNTDIFNLLFYFSDYVIGLKSFLVETAKLQDYDALLKIEKLPQVCAFKTVFMETDTYGVLVEKRKVVIEKIDIGVEIDRNTKVKESDMASLAMCGQEKYSKSYEF